MIVRLPLTIRMTCTENASIAEREISATENAKSEKGWPIMSGNPKNRMPTMFPRKYKDFELELDKVIEVNIEYAKELLYETANRNVEKTDSFEDQENS